MGIFNVCLCITKCISGFLKVLHHQRSHWFHWCATTYCEGVIESCLKVLNPFYWLYCVSGTVKNVCTHMQSEAKVRSFRF